MFLCILLHCPQYQLDLLFCRKSLSRRCLERFQTSEKQISEIFDCNSKQIHWAGITITDVFWLVFLVKETAPRDNKSTNRSIVAKHISYCPDKIKEFQNKQFSLKTCITFSFVLQPHLKPQLANEERARNENREKAWKKILYDWLFRFRQFSVISEQVSFELEPYTN